jgi:hypothetical protein
LLGTIVKVVFVPHSLFIFPSAYIGRENTQHRSGRHYTVCFVVFYMVFSPGYQQVVTGEGMPINKVAPGGKRFEQINADVSTKGDLILRFTIEFPENLTEKQKKLISQADL